MGENMLIDVLNRIVVVGTGGTGSFLLPVLMRYINSLKKKVSIFFVDGDKYDEGNIARQEFAHSRVGVNKAQAQFDVFAQKFPELDIIPVAEYIGEKNIADIITDKSVVFCCVDNHFARNLISKYCQSIDNVLLISGGNEETDGNVQAFFRMNGKSLNCPIESRHPEIERRKDGDRSEMSCEQLAALPGGGQVIFANLFSATLMACMFFSYNTNQSIFSLRGVKNISSLNEVLFDVTQVKTLRVIDNEND